MGPGPSDVYPAVLNALSEPTIGHLDPAFVALMDDTKNLLRYAFQTKNSLTIPISGPGSAGMECCFVNALEPGDKVIIAINGVFGLRMAEVASRIGAHIVKVEFSWGHPVDPNQVEDVLNRHRDARVLAFVHAETSTGVLSSAPELCELARKHDCLTIVDAVTSLGGIELLTDAWGIDAVYSGSQKCLSAPPGISPATFSDQFVARLKSRRIPVQSWFLDLGMLASYWNPDAKRSYHHTAPVNAIYGLHKALKILRDSGLKETWARHLAHHKELRAGLEQLGLDFFVEEQHRLPQLNTITVPTEIDDAQVRQGLLEQDGLEIGAGLGPLAGKVWRVGLMGASCNSENVRKLLIGMERQLGCR